MKSYHQRIRPVSLNGLEWRFYGPEANAQALCVNSIGWNNVHRAKKMAMRRALIASRMREDATLSKYRWNRRVRVKAKEITPALIMAITKKTAHIQ